MAKWRTADGKAVHKYDNFAWELLKERGPFYISLRRYSMAKIETGRCLKSKIICVTHAA